MNAPFSPSSVPPSSDPPFPLHPPLDAWSRKVGPIDPGFDAAIKDRLDHLTKPLGSLGRLEDVAFWYARLHGSDRPPAPRGACVVFAGDHGVTAEGVSAYPSSVTREMVLNYLRGGRPSAFSPAPTDSPSPSSTWGWMGSCRGPRG